MRIVWVGSGAVATRYARLSALFAERRANRTSLSKNSQKRRAYRGSRQPVHKAEIIIMI